MLTVAIISTAFLLINSLLVFPVGVFVLLTRSKGTVDASIFNFLRNSVLANIVALFAELVVFILHIVY